MTLLIPHVVTADTFEKAVLAGNVKAVEHLLARKCDFSKYFLLICALTSGSHEMVKYLHENKLVDTFPTYQDIHTAIYFNRLESIKYFVPRWYNNDLYSIAICALELNRLEIYNYLKSFITDPVVLCILNKEYHIRHTNRIFRPFIRCFYMFVSCITFIIEKFKKQHVQNERHV